MFCGAWGVSATARAGFLGLMPILIWSEKIPISDILYDILYDILRYIFFGAFCAFIRTGHLKSGQETGEREGE